MRVLEFYCGIFQDWKVLEKKPLVLERSGNLLNSTKRSKRQLSIESLYVGQFTLLYLSTQIRFLIGGERVTCHWSKLNDTGEQNSLTPQGNNNLNFGLARDQTASEVGQRFSLAIINQEKRDS